MQQKSVNSKLIKVTLLEGIHPSAQVYFESQGCQVTLLPHSPSGVELQTILKESDIVGIRSKTQIRSQDLKEAVGGGDRGGSGGLNSRLLAIGCFCIGTDQVDLIQAGDLGIPVFNAPYSNTRSVAELVIAEVIALSRKLMDLSAGVHAGKWSKTADGSFEVRGKTLGIIGYGHIGSQVSILAEAMGMRVVFYDIVKKLPLGNSTKLDSLGELLEISDFVTLHVPDTPQTRWLIGDDEFQRMKKGAYLLNLSRGSVVDIQALSRAIKSGHLAGAGVDVFPEEPSRNGDVFKNELQGLPNIILTPHIGGSTEEAQEAIGVEVAQSLSGYLLSGSTRGAVNFPNVDLPVIQNAHRILNVHQNVPGVLREINSVVSEVGANIQAQYLSTNSSVGYLVMDMEKGEADDVGDKIKRIKTSIKTRVLY